MLRVETISEMTSDILIWSLFLFRRLVLTINDNNEKKKRITATINEIIIRFWSQTVLRDTSNNLSNNVVCCGFAKSVIKKNTPKMSHTIKLDMRIQYTRKSGPKRFSIKCWFVPIVSTHSPPFKMQIKYELIIT